MSHAIVLRDTGGPEKLQYEPVDVAAPGPDELQIRHTVIGVNFHDTYVRSGLYDTLKLPGIPGLEAAAVVEKAGARVRGFAAGDRIAYIDTAYGAYSERRLLQASLAVRLPDSITDEAAGSLFIKGLTVCMLLRKVHPVRARQTLLIHAAAGGVGQPLVRWAKHLGATVIATVGSEEKAAIARQCGADHVILYRRENFVDRIAQITGGRGVEVVYDSVGKDTFSGSLDCLDYLGTLVNFGQSSGPVAPFAIARLSAKSNTIVRPMLFHYIRGRAALEAMAAESFEAIDQGIIRPEVGLRLPLSRAAEAHVRLESRATTGQIVLVP
ncbi:MAG TPA: quinone oxidoreductase [Steroidobacteraceae bacterium]|nr:quinone oxidoreductase [Steroidobacteraceae bacterium]